MQPQWRAVSHRLGLPLSGRHCVVSSILVGPVVLPWVFEKVNCVRERFGSVASSVNTRSQCSIGSSKIALWALVQVPWRVLGLVFLLTSAGAPAVHVLRHVDPPVFRSSCLRSPCHVLLHHVTVQQEHERDFIDHKSISHGAFSEYGKMITLAVVELSLQGCSFFVHDPCS